MSTTPKRQLIINADGFGFTHGNNKGILECIGSGAVTSVSVNANFPPYEETKALVSRFPSVSIGIHLNLSVGPCVSDPALIPDLVDSQGQFLGNDFRWKAICGRIPNSQMVRELSAQVQRLLELGVKISHWDSHQNQHLYPPFFRAAIEVSRRFGILRMRTHKHYLFDIAPNRFAKSIVHLLTHPARLITYAATRYQMYRARRFGLAMPDRLITANIIGNLKKTDRAFWTSLFHHLPSGVNEIYCHPGYPDAYLEANATYVQERQLELEILRDPHFRMDAKDSGVELVNFYNIPIHLML